jgi:hypothetical protein
MCLVAALRFTLDWTAIIQELIESAMDSETAFPRRGSPARKLHEAQRLYG